MGRVMAGLADHLGPLLMTSHGARAKRAPSLRQIISRAHTRAGTWKATAAALGISEATLRRWRNGTQKPSADRLERVRQWDTMSRMRRHLDDKTIKLEFTFDGRWRTVTAKDLRLQPGTLDACRKEWVEKGPQAAVGRFLERIGDPNGWYRKHLTAWEAQEQAKATRAALDLDGEDDDELWARYVAELEEMDPDDFHLYYGSDASIDDMAGEESAAAENAEYQMSVIGM